MPRFKHSGKMGDVVFSLPFVRDMGGGDLLLEVDFIEGGAPRLSRAAYESLRPLLLAQDYVESVSVYDGEMVDYDLDIFRNVIPWSGCNLVDANYICHDKEPNMKNHMDPWIEAPNTLEAFRGKVIISRTNRHLGEGTDRSVFFSQMGRQNLDKGGVFIGLYEEWKWFTEVYQITIEHFQPDNTCDIAAALKVASLWVGNENFVGAVAEALKVTSIRELNKTSTQEKMYCAFRRPNLLYV